MPCLMGKIGCKIQVQGGVFFQPLRHLAVHNPAAGSGGAGAGGFDAREPLDESGDRMR